MNTPAHLILGLAAFGKPGWPRVTVAAIAGSLIPDLSLYLLAGASMALGLPHDVIFGELYFSDLWQSIFAIDNSWFVWAAVLTLGLWLRRPWLWTLAAAAMLHLASDLPLHHDDGRAQFWPLTDQIYASPFSYWDTAYGAGWIAPLLLAMVVVLAVVLYRRFDGWTMRLTILALVLAEFSISVVWLYAFG